MGTYFECEKCGRRRALRGDPILQRFILLGGVLVLVAWGATTYVSKHPEIPLPDRSEFLVGHIVLGLLWASVVLAMAVIALGVYLGAWQSDVVNLGAQHKWARAYSFGLAALAILFLLLVIGFVFVASEAAKPMPYCLKCVLGLP